MLALLINNAPTRAVGVTTTREGFSAQTRRVVTTGSTGRFDR